MLRMVLAAVTFSLATPVVASAAAPEVKELKAERKAAKKYSKSVDKAVSKWQKAYDKDNATKMSKADADLDQIISEELTRLRKAGIPTRKAEPLPRPEPTRLVDGERVPLKDLMDEGVEYHLDYLRWRASTEPPPPEFPLREAYRDDLVTLRDITRASERGSASRAELRRKQRLLAELDKKVEKRLERADARLEQAKG